MKQMTAMCPDRASADNAIQALIDAGVGSEDVSVLVVEDGDLREAPMQHRTLVPQGAAVGSAAGAAIGVALVGVGWIPGVLAIGPVLAALQGLASGAAVGTLMGALAGLGWWKSEADIPADELRAGGVLVGVSIADDRVGELLDVLKSAGARRIDVA